MIYSRLNGLPVNVRIQAKHYHSTTNLPPKTSYDIFDGHRKVGYVHLTDLHNGCYVDFIKNEYPELYKGFGAFADQLEVEHCLKRRLFGNFEIRSCAGLNSHALHYLRGKRFTEVLDPPSIKRLTEKFESKNVNEIVDDIIARTPKGEMYDTRAIGKVRMYMPQNMIERNIELSKKSPVLTDVVHTYLA